jgi:tetratricopeptide (TPR) repeat protein
VTRFLLAGLLLAGAALRAAYLGDLREAPDWASPLADAAFHDYWAKGLARGDWTPPAGEPDPRIREVPFLRPPGYPYFLALVYKVAGTDPLVPRVAQMLLGIANVVLAWRLGRRIFGEGAALTAAALCAVWWAIPYFEGELQAPALAQTLALSTMLALSRWAARPAWGWAVAGGVLAGALALVWANAALFLPVAALWVFAGAGERSRGRALHALAFCVAAGLAILPATARNLVVSGELVPISENGAINLWIGNNEEADGVSSRVPELAELTGLSGWSWFSYDRIVQGVARREGAEPDYSDAARFFRRRALEWIRANPGAFLQLTIRRAVLFWGPDEISNNEAIRFEKEASRVLAWQPGFAVVSSAFVVGLVLAGAAMRAGRAERAGIRDPATVRLVAAFVAVWFVSYLPFLAAARFRVPLLPFLFLFVGYALARGVALAKTGAWSRLGAGLAVWAGVWLVARVPVSDSASVDRAWWHTDRGVAFANAGRSDDAVTEFRAALAANPGYVDARTHLASTLLALGRTEEAAGHLRQVVAERPERSDLRMQLVGLLVGAGRWREAVVELEEAARREPLEPGVQFELGRALVETGRPEEGIAAFRRSLELAPGQSVAHANVGIALSKLGRRDEAIAEFRESLDLNPFSAEVHYHLGNELAAAGRRDEAAAAFEEAIRVEPKYVEPRVHLGNLCNERGDWAKAVEWYEKALAIDAKHVTALYNLAGSLGNLGRLDEAIAALERLLEENPGHELARERLRVLREMKGRGSP